MTPQEQPDSRADTPTKMKLNLAKSGHQHRPEDITYIAKEAAHNKSGQSLYMCVVCGEITKLLDNRLISDRTGGGEEQK